jgi:hypothetical protein
MTDPRAHPSSIVGSVPDLEISVLIPETAPCSKGENNMTLRKDLTTAPVAQENCGETGFTNGRPLAGFARRALR